jgi:hypothetical protein
MADMLVATLRALLSLDNTGYLEGLEDSHNKAAEFASNMSKVGGAVVVGSMVAAATVITAVGVAAWDAGMLVDDAMDTIAVATGATGPQLAGLQDDFKNVFTSVPTDAKTAADAIGILNSRLDLSGPALQNIAKPLLEATRLLGGDITTNAEGFTRVMGDWSLPAERASVSLDQLFKAAQETGAPLDQLMERVVQYGAPMRNFGFDFVDTTAILASFEAQGVNTETVMGGLRTAQGKFITQGKDMHAGLWETVDAIQNAASSTDALAIATEVFGAKAAGDMFDTIRSGKFDVEKLSDVLWDTNGTIMEAGKGTADWGEKWTMFKNRATLALAPLGSTMMDGVSKAMDAAVAIFERPDVQAGLTTFVTMIGSFITQAVTYIPVLIEGFLSFITFLQNNQGFVIGILAALGVAAMAWGITTAIAAWTAMAPFLPVIAVLVLIAAAAYLLYQAWTTNFGGIQEKMSAVWAAVQPVLQMLWDWLQVNIPLALAALSAFWTGTLLPAIQAVWSWISTNLLPLFQTIGEVVGTVIHGAFVTWMAGMTEVTIPTLKKLYDYFVVNILPTLQKVGSWIQDKVVTAFGNLTSGIGWVTDKLKDLNTWLNTLKLPSWLTPGSPTPWELGLVGIGSALQSLTSADLPQFDAALQLHADPFAANGAINLQPRAAGVATETGGGRGAVSSEALLQEMRNMLADLPNTIARANRVTLEKVTVSRSQ